MTCRITLASHFCACEIKHMLNQLLPVLFYDINLQLPQDFTKENVKLHMD